MHKKEKRRGEGEERQGDEIEEGKYAEGEEEEEEESERQAECRSLEEFDNGLRVFRSKACTRTCAHTHRVAMLCAMLAVLSADLWETGREG